MPAPQFHARRAERLRDVGGSGDREIPVERGAAANADVRGTNRCKIWVNVDPATGLMIVVSHIDNLMKGASGQAVQNMNLMFGLPETTALDQRPLFP